MSRSRTTTSDSSATGSATAPTLTRTTRSRAQIANTSASSKPTASRSTKELVPAAIPPPARTRRRIEPAIDESPTKASSTVPTATRMMSLKDRAAAATATSQITASGAGEGSKNPATRAPARTARPPTRTVSAATSAKKGDEVDELAVALQDNLRVEPKARVATKVLSGARSAPTAANPAVPRTRVTSGSTISSSTTNTSAARARTRTDSSDKSISNPGSIPKPRTASRLAPARTSKQTVLDTGRHARAETSSTTTTDPARINVIPLSTSLHIPARLLDSAETQKAKMTINRCITSFKSAQVEGYRYEKPTAGRRLSAQAKKEPETDKDKEWTDSKVKEVVDSCSAALRCLTGHLLATKSGAPDWNAEAIAAVQLRMQIAKACSDFGLHASTVKLMVETRPLTMILLGHESDGEESRRELDDVVFLPSEKTDLGNLDSRTRMAIFSWLSMLWLAITNKALHGASEQEMFLVLETFSKFRTKSGASCLNPLDLTRGLELDICKNYLMMLYSRIGKLLASASGIAGTGLDADTTHLLLLVCAGSASPQGKVTIPSVWAQVRRESERLARQALSSPGSNSVNREDVEMVMARRIAAMIDDVIQFVVTDGRKGKLSDWQAGEEWEGLMDLWVGLCRALGDVKGVEKALTYLQTAPCAPTDPADVLDEGIAKLSLDGDSGSSSISVVCGKLAKVVTLLDQPKLSDLANEVGKLLQDPRPLRVVKQACEGLPEEELLYTLGKISRAVDRVRSRLVKIIDQAKQGVSVSPTLLDGSKSWLASTFDMIESLLQGPCSQVEYHERHADLTAIAIDTAMTLSKSALMPQNPDSRDRSLDLLKRSESLFRASRAPTSDLQDWARCLSNAAWSCGAGIYRIELFVPATPFVQMAVELGDHALETYRASQSGLTEIDRDWDALRNIMSPRWEALSVCYMRSGRKTDSLNARISCIQAQPDILQHLENQSKSRPPSILFTPANKISAVLARLASVLIGESLFLSNTEERFEEKFFANCTDRSASAAMAEHLVTCMQHVEYRPEVAALMQALLHKTILVYRESESPIREVRCIARLLEHCLAVGAPLQGLDELVARAFDLLKGDLGQDLKLVAYKNQYKGELHMLVATEACATRDSDLLNILKDHAAEAGQCLVGLVDKKRLPLSPVARKTAARSGLKLIQQEMPLPAIDDRASLCNRLDKFIGLLSMQSHALVQLEFLRIKRGLERDDPSLLSDYLVSSVRLAAEYARLGKMKRAGTIFASARNAASKSAASTLSVEQRVDFELGYALYLAAIGNTTKSGELYNDVRRLSQPEAAPKGGSSTAKIRHRCAVLERAALANLVLAEIAHVQDNAIATIRYRSVAFRLLSRAAENLARIAPRAVSAVDTPKPIDEDPFGPPLQNAKPEDAPAVDDINKDTKPSHFTGKQLIGKHLSLIGDLLTSSLQLAGDLLSRGSARDAMNFVNEAKSLAVVTGSPYWSAKISCAAAEVNIALRQYAEANSNVEQSLEILSEVEGPEFAEAHRILAELQSRQITTEDDSELIEAAEEAFEATKQVLSKLEGSFTVSDRLAGTPVKATDTPTKRANLLDTGNTLLAATRTRVLIQQARLLRRIDRMDESNELLEQARNIQQGAMFGADELHIIGTTSFSAALNRFKSDLFLNSMTESTISMPVGTVNDVDGDIAQSRNAISATLQDAESAFQSYISLRGNAGNVSDVREATVTIAMLRAYQASLGRNSVQYTRGAASLLDSSCSITLRRELLEIMSNRNRDSRLDEMVWSTEIPGPVSLPSSSADSDEDDTELAISNPTGPAEAAAAVTMFDEPDLSNMPSNWCAISVNVTDDGTTMFVSRRQRNRPPVIFTLPLDRQGKREEEDECFTLETALTELRQIIADSDASARSAKDVDRTDRTAKTQWWSRRKELDKRLKDLLDTIEFCWLGAFKTIFNPAGGRSPKALAAFRKTLEDTFARTLSHGDKSKRSRIQLDDSIVECFSTLSSKSKDQELEDLVYFILDLHQFNGIGVALAEIDIETLAMDVQNALQQFEQSWRAESISPVADEHIFLILDRNVQEIPWESLPILRGRAISRVPSLAFLVDRLPKPMPGADFDPDSLRKGVNPQKTFFILNPSGDLGKTQQTFGPWLEGMVEKCGWKGIVGREPTSLEIKSALQNYELVLYFGHGGMEQYISSRAIRELPKCASVMIWGCSSGLMKDQGDLDRIGTPYNYMVGGAPSLTAVLWDVTDAEIDKIAQSTSSQLRMDESHMEEIRAGKTDLPDSAISNAQALSKARECCKLKYLTGAAPVAYGIPLYFRQEEPRTV